MQNDDSAQLSHMEIVGAISGIAARVFGILIPAQTMADLGPDQLERVLRHDVIEVLKRRKLGDAAYIQGDATWSNLMRQADERLQLAFIALVLAIYE